MAFVYQMSHKQRIAYLIAGIISPFAIFGYALLWAWVIGTVACI